jgi:hypothetical protein
LFFTWGCSSLPRPFHGLFLGLLFLLYLGSVVHLPNSVAFYLGLLFFGIVVKLRGSRIVVVLHLGLLFFLLGSIFLLKPEQIFLFGYFALNLGLLFLAGVCFSPPSSYFFSGVFFPTGIWISLPDLISSLPKSFLRYLALLLFS